MQNHKTTVDYISKKKPNAVLNMALWFLYYAILLFIFSEGKTPKNIDYVYTLGFVSVMIIPIVINTHFFVPRLLQKGKYILFFIAFLGTILLFWQFYIHFFEQLMDVVFQEYYFISYQTNLQAITKFVLLLLVSILIKTFESWLYYNAAQNQFLQMENQRIQIQLAQLRSQINPHFLFNSLNVIYALAIENKEETPEAIVQLSDVLRYIIYDADSDKISLKDEITLLKNYIAFQKFRTHGLEDITFAVDIENENFKIYPMLLLPLVENAFKHGMTTMKEATFVQISLQQKKDTFNFQITNHNEIQPPKTKETYAGVGLENIQHNLEIVYPNNHQFQIDSNEETFTVSLQIQEKTNKT